MKREELLIEADELLTRLGDANLRIYDATMSDEAYQQGHIPGAAIFYHTQFSDPSSLNMLMLLPPAELAAQIGRIGIANDSQVVVYACGMLPFATRAAWVLRYAGHNNVRVLNGGLSAWKRAGGVIEVGAQEYAPTTFAGQFRPGMIFGKEAVLEALQAGEASVVNVLPAASYAAAHIPGSANLSCISLMHEMNAFLPNDQLALLLKEQAQYTQIITYCGGGIAATVNALAHLMVGQEQVAVYDGSLYEWEAEGLPLAGTGNWQAELRKLMK